MTRAWNVVLPCVILESISHKNFAIEIANTKWRVTGGQIWIDKAVGVHLMKILIISFDFARVEVGYIQEIVIVGHAQCCAFVNGSVTSMVPAIIDGDNSVCLVEVRVPA